MIRRTDFLHRPKLKGRMRQRTVWDWRLKLYPLIVIPAMVYLNVAPQPSTVRSPRSTAPSQEGVGQGEVASATPDPVHGIDGKGRHYLIERSPE
jgi:hypothetical protein